MLDLIRAIFPSTGGMRFGDGNEHATKLRQVELARKHQRDQLAGGVSDTTVD